MHMLQTVKTPEDIAKEKKAKQNERKAKQLEERRESLKSLAVELIGKNKISRSYLKDKIMKNNGVQKESAYKTIREMEALMIIKIEDNECSVVV